MHRNFRLLAVVAAAVAVALPLQAAFAAEAQSAGNAAARAEIAKSIPGTKPGDVRETPMKGIYEVTRDGDIAYVSADGRFAIAGDLYDLSSSENLTEARRREVRLDLLASVPEAQMVIFGPAQAKYTITVFTDVDCGYCRKLHSQIAEYNKLGVRVRYLFYPRTGPGTESWTKAQQVWCAPNRRDALTRAKLGEPIESPKCAASPVAKHFELGEKIGIRGTPAIFLESGEMLPGYVPPAMLVEHLSTAGGG